VAKLATEGVAERAPGSSSGNLEGQLEQHRVELTAYAYRMLGSSFEAEDAVQETLLRAWRSLDRFEGRAALRTWLYQIATNVCLDMSKSRQRRARPMDLGPPQGADSPLGDQLPEVTWLEPIPDGRVLPNRSDPAELTLSRESIKLAFVAALQHLPPRQRAVLILREVLRWKATEVAELLETTVASVNSALQRARTTLSATEVTEEASLGSMDEQQRDLLARYVDAFERYDMDALTSVLHEDATWSMPPYPLWLQGHPDIRRFCMSTGIGCKDSRLIPTTANGSPAFGQYKPSASGVGYEPWALQVLEMSGGEIAGICFFLDTGRFFPMFDLPLALEG
jgi:RNA polymerase sigma-70 factor, ECF subfamily